MATAEATAATIPSDRIAAAARLAVVDRLRGLVIVLMALDHVREFLHVQALFHAATDLATTTPALFATRWITHLCAPVFVALAGASAWLQLEAGKTPGEVARQLVLRGLWLVFLEIAVVSASWSFDFVTPYFQVIGAIGVAMVVLAAFVRLPPGVALAAGVGLVAGHNLLDGVSAQSLGALAPLWVFLHEPGFLRLGPLSMEIAYPVAAWVGVMLAGFGAGRIWSLAPATRDRALLASAAALLALFLGLRALNGYGDPAGWTVLASPAFTAMSFLNLTKYPPSLEYVAVTLGLALMLAPALQRLPPAAGGLFEVYGRVPLFFYLIHAPVIHLAAMAIGTAQGYPPGAFVGMFVHPEPLQGYGLQLPGIYAVWIFVLALTYPPCRWWGQVKRTRRDWWLSYL